MASRPYNSNPLRRRLYLPGLLAASIVVLLIPAQWVGWCISLVQVLVPVQHATAVVADAVADTLHAPASNDDPLEIEAARREAALTNTIASLALRVAELEREVEILAGTRLWGGIGQRLGARGRLVPARVITEDLLPWRSSRLINTGSLQGVRRGSAVASCYFSIDRGSAAGLRDGYAALLKEQFVGFVERVGTHTARIKLLSDVTVSMKVRIGRLTETGFEAQDSYFWLTGRGRGRMQIREVDRRLTDLPLPGQQTGRGADPQGSAETSRAAVHVGDLVLSDPLSELLPAPMTIGTITRIEVDEANPLLAILTVESGLDFSTLRRVYVYDPNPEDDDRP